MTTITETPETDVTRKISKVKILKNGCGYVEFEQTKIIMLDGKPIEKIDHFPMTGENLVHPNLTHSLSLLRSHLAILCSQLDGRDEDLKEIEDDEKFLDNFNVTGLSVGGSGEHEGVTLVGSRKIKRGVINLVTPFMKFEDPNNPYEFQTELNYLTNHTIDEFDQYIDGKIAPNAQQELPFDGEDNSDLES